MMHWIARGRNVRAVATPDKANNCTASLNSMFSAMLPPRSPKPVIRPRFFVKSQQGFERRFLSENFKRYFGDDVRWFRSIDMSTGDEGFEVDSPLHEKSKQTLVNRMREDARKEHQQFLERHRERTAGNVDFRRRLENQESIYLVDRAPQEAAARCPHLDLFPPLNVPATLAPPQPLRQYHSMPSSPILEYYTPTMVLPSPARTRRDHPASLQPAQPPMRGEAGGVPFFEGAKVWRPETWEEPEFRYETPGVPNYRLSHMPQPVSERQYHHHQQKQTLRPTRSAENLVHANLASQFDTHPEYLHVPKTPPF